MTVEELLEGRRRVVVVPELHLRVDGHRERVGVVGIACVDPHAEIERGAEVVTGQREQPAAEVGVVEIGGDRVGAVEGALREVVEGGVGDLGGLTDVRDAEGLQRAHVGGHVVHACSSAVTAALGAAVGDTTRADASASEPELVGVKKTTRPTDTPTTTAHASQTTSVADQREPEPRERAGGRSPKTPPAAVVVMKGWRPRCADASCNPGEATPGTGTRAGMPRRSRPRRRSTRCSGRC